MFENLSEAPRRCRVRPADAGGARFGGRRQDRPSARSESPLLEADVSLPVARDFVKAVQEKATGQAVTKSGHPPALSRSSRSSMTSSSMSSAATTPNGAS